MPPAAAAVAPLAASLAAGAAAAGTAIAAGAAAIGTAASAGLAAVGGLSGLATGISMASGAIGLIGAVTGSKTLQKIGMYGGMVGGLGSGAAMLAGGGAAAAGSTAASSASKAASAGFKAFPSAAGGAGATMSNIGGIAGVGNSAASGLSAAAGVLPEATKAGSTNVIQRMNEMLTRYDTTANVLSGMGQGYVMHKSNELQKEQLGLQKDKFGFEKEQYNTQQTNRAAVPTLPSSIGAGIKKADGTPLLNMGAR